MYNKMRGKSLMAEQVGNAIRHSIDKFLITEKIIMNASKEKVMELEEKIDMQQRDIYSY